MGDLLGLAGRRHTQVRPRLGPCAGEIGMRQRLALVAIEQNDVAGFGLLLAQLQPHPDPFDVVGVSGAPSGCAAAAANGTFFSQRLGQLRPADANPLLAPRSRLAAAVSSSCVGRLPVASSKGVTTRKAASLFTAAGPGATLAFSAATPPRMKSLRHRRTVSSRTPNASAIRALVQPASVSSIARALSASPRSREPAREGERQSLFFARRQPRNSSHALPPRINASTGTESSRQPLVNWPDSA